ncbi:MAG: proline--tRNA ligase [Erysipelothrix sp.]|nr:proline--tRNA ligase [Erysipelothrix sp.]
MRLSESFFYSLRENVKDEDSTSGNLLVRAGMIKKVSSGVYMLLPLGKKAFNKIENIVRDEMNKIGSLEVSMPALIPEDVYIDSGRRDNFGKSMFALKDRNDKNFVLGPTHEELFAAAAKMAIKSYKHLPFSIYQFQTKYRDEPRPRFGLIRVREFVMKDAYTFDKDLHGLDLSYSKMFQAYKNSFDRMGLDYVIVKADTGVMGGLLSEEFQALSEIGEDILVIQPDSHYASNLEIAGCVIEETPQEKHLQKELVYTPNSKTIEEVTNFLKQDIKKFVKTLIYKVDQELVALCVRGDHEVNETKVLKLLKAQTIEMANPQEVFEATNAPVGFAGPQDLNIRVICDQQLSVMSNFIVGANQADHHYINMNLEDFSISEFADIRNIVENDMCENNQGPVVFKRGIEIGNTFKLGEKYSIATNLYYANEENKLEPVIMGSYGIGIGRCLAAIVEQNHTDKGIVWPKAIAPIQVSILVINTKDEKQMEVANYLYTSLIHQGFDVLLDDRAERPGVKFNDNELIGAFATITVGKDITDNLVEFSVQNSDKELVSIQEIENKIVELFK